MAEPGAELVAAQGHPTVRGKVRTRNQLLSWVSSSSHHNWGLGPLTLEEGMGLPQELSIILVETPELVDQHGLWSHTDLGSTPLPYCVILGRLLPLSDTWFPHL